MLGISVVPGVLLFLAMLPLGDSARWYVKMGRRTDAEAVLKRAEPHADVDAQVTSIEQAMAGDRPATWVKCLPDQWRKPLIVAAGLALLQQFTGINSCSSTTPTPSSPPPGSHPRLAKALPPYGPSVRSTCSLPW